MIVYAMLVLAALIAFKLAYDEFDEFGYKREVRCQYCENASPQIHHGFGGFVHVIDGREYECERPTFSPREEEHIRHREDTFNEAEILDETAGPVLTSSSCSRDS
jgi:hypothetical protein